MKAAVYYGPGEVRLEEMPDPVAGEGELLLDVATVGICGSDVGEYVHEPHFFPVGEKHPFSGHVGPTIPGHEFSGTVASVWAPVLRVLRRVIWSLPVPGSHAVAARPAGGGPRTYARPIGRSGSTLTAPWQSEWRCRRRVA